MQALIEYVTANYGMILAVLLGLSEALALIPGIKANSIFQLIYNVIKSLKPAPKV